jgi:hypothetical protein
MPWICSHRPQHSDYGRMIRKITSTRSSAAKQDREKSLAQRIWGLPNALIRLVKKAASSRLREVAPPGLDPTTQDDLGDAFRHYNSSAELQKYVGSNITRWIGEALESGPNNSKSKTMDLANNEAGIKSSERNPNADRAGTALDLLNDVSKGKITIIDPEKGLRKTTPVDVPSSSHSGERD